jgi:hypothetical protein
MAGDPALSREEAEDAQAEPPPGTGAHQGGVAYVDAVDGVQIRLDEQPFLQE